MRVLGVIVPTIHTLSVLMMISMVATPSFFGFIIYLLSQTHLSLLSIAVAILFLDGLALLVVGIVRSVLPVSML